MQDFSSSSWIALLGRSVADFIATLASILVALPDAPEGLRTVLAAPAAGLQPGQALSMSLAAVAILAVLAGILRRAGPGSRLAGRLGWAPLWGVLADDLATASGILLAAGLCVAIAFDAAGLGSELAAATVWGGARWLISMVVVDMVLRPGHPDLRLLPVADDRIPGIRRLAGAAIALALAFVSLMPVLLVHGMPLLPARATALAGAALDGLLAFAALRALARGLGGRARSVVIAGALVLGAGWWIWTRSVVRLDFTLWDAFTGTVVLALVVAIADGLGRLAGRVPDTAAAGAMPHVAAAIRRGAIAILLVAGGAVMAHAWLVDVLELVAEQDWPMVSKALGLGVGVALAGTLAHEALGAWTALRFGPARAPALPGTEDDVAVSGSRMATVLPLLSRVLLAASVGIGALLGLANLGVNVSPLLAGAGIFGLALSFGSQALVRDIVSGFFFIAEDAFRVGEYIDTGRHKGSVERISLRSLRLRHQNGQVHTLPYGQIAAVTNFSRDWATVKFNLRMAPATDLERVRKLAKRVGQGLLEDPEWGPEFLVQLKLQGIADVIETAVVLRFKFTARPGKVASLQREVVRRLFEALLADGVRFATNAVVFRSEDAGTAPLAEAEAEPSHAVQRLPVWARMRLAGATRFTRPRPRRLAGPRDA